jgi:hypothetical protein
MGEWVRRIKWVGKEGKGYNGDIKINEKRKEQEIC